MSKRSQGHKHDMKSGGKTTMGMSIETEVDTQTTDRSRHQGIKHPLVSRLLLPVKLGMLNCL